MAVASFRATAGAGQHKISPVHDGVGYADKQDGPFHRADNGRRDDGRVLQLRTRPGERSAPELRCAGIWLYSNGNPILHVLEKDEILRSAGVLDHVALWGTDLAGFIDKLKARGVTYDLRRVPEGDIWSGAWQLFFQDPNGVRLEINIDAGESRPPDT